MECREICPKYQSAFADVTDTVKFTVEKTSILLKGIKFGELTEELLEKLKLCGIEYCQKSIPINLKLCLIMLNIIFLRRDAISRLKRLNINENKLLQKKIAEYQCTQNNPVNSEELEIVLADIVHKKFYGKDRDNKSRHHAGYQYGRFAGLKIKAEFGHFVCACSEHGGDGEEKGKLGGSRPGDADQHGSQYGGSGAGGAGDEREQLKNTDYKRAFICNALHRSVCDGAVFIPALHYDKSDAV